MNQHLKVHDNKQWECDVCKKTFTTKYFLKKHKRLHTGETPYACNICGKSFTFQQSYHKHMLYHTDDKPYTCTQCGRAFKELSTLQNHERIHSGERPFACETCGKSFRQRVSYLVHRFVIVIGALTRQILIGNSNVNFTRHVFDCFSDWQMPRQNTAIQSSNTFLKIMIFIFQENSYWSYAVCLQ